MTDGKEAINNNAVAKAEHGATGHGSTGTEPLTRDKGTRPTQTKAPSKKRRKVNHACVYCRRSHMTCDLERPCMRCIKRNIGHLCHDEPRDTDAKKPRTAKGGASAAAIDPAASAASTASAASAVSAASATAPDDADDFDNDPARQTAAHVRPSDSLEPAVMGQGAANPLALVQPSSASGLSGNGVAAPSVSGNTNQFAGFSDAWLTAQNLNDMNSYPANYMVAPQVTHEFNLLSDFLHSGLLDGSGLEPEGSQNSSSVALPCSEMPPGFAAGNRGSAAAPGAADAVGGPGGPAPAVLAMGAAAPGSMPPPPLVLSRGHAAATDKTREYYLQAADPSGSDNAEERMGRVLRAKYEAGLLRPFNYINGYARLGQYLDGHIAATSKQKILRTIGQFRPKFREKAQGLTDMQLVYVEMWFERQLMDYDRVFASMAVPACCWRRTGEIFRGNKEMAELIGVPVDQLRDGKIALHEILTEESMVRYWEEFGTIAFDPAHETLLTACSLKNPSDASKHPIVKCCFSFTIRRDEHKLPALIVGNFLPHDTPQP